MTTKSIWMFGAMAVLAFLHTPSAVAVTNEPNGLQVPLDSKNGEVQLYTLFQNRGDPVDWLADAHTTPATFSPLCNFKATFVLHQASAKRGVGWYNVDPAATAPPTQIHVIVPAGTPVGTVVSSTTIIGDPAYAGGLIGFALVDGQTHYSEQQWNVQCVPPFCPVQAPWILTVTYQSKSTPNAYYLAFEDGSVSALGFGNDGDFNDDVFLFEGLTCEGGGTPCSTGQPGMCDAGLNECSATGLVCKPSVTPEPEKCDGLDNDCNGKTDDGDLCDPGFVCDHGTCVARCSGTEFPCEVRKVCNGDGYCVDPACAATSCPDGTVCVAGACKAACDGIMCPGATVCRAGACVNPCAGLECPTGTVCDRGVCAPKCNCNPCPQGLGCDTGTGLCMEPACVGVVCAPNARCVSGVCADACAGAVCPSGQICVAGACVASMDAGASSTGGTASGVPIFPGGAGGGSGAAPPAREAGIGPSISSVDSGLTSSPAEPLTCGCRIGFRGPEPHFPAQIAMLVLATWIRSRTRRRSRRAAFVSLPLQGIPTSSVPR